MGDFDAKMAELAEKVGDGRIVGRVTFSPEKIAVPMHEAGWATGPLAASHPRGSGLDYTTPGTGADYLQGPLLQNGERYFHDIAREILTTGPRIPMERAVDSLLHEALTRVPRRTGQLAESGEARVSEELSGASVR
jgi:hypothetical protein